MLKYLGVLAVFGGSINLERVGPGTLEFYNGNGWVTELLINYRDYHAMVMLPCQTTTTDTTSRTETTSNTNMSSTSNSADKTVITMVYNETALPKVGVLLLGGKSDLGPMEYIKQVMNDLIFKYP
jgi:hypothetical protein